MTFMLSVTDELKSVGLVYTMLRKCFGDDFDGKAVIPQIAFSTDFKVGVNDSSVDRNEFYLSRMPSLNFPTMLVNNCKATGKIVHVSRSNRSIRYPKSTRIRLRITVVTLHAVVVVVVAAMVMVSTNRDEVALVPVEIETQDDRVSSDHRF